MAGRKDYYATLGVSKGATADEIKRAYRKLARKWHPDVNPGDSSAEERFKEISEAYHVLGDEKRRKQYDQVGPEMFAQEFDMSDFANQFGSFFRGGFSGAGPASAGGDFGMFEEILGGLGGFGSRSGPQRPPRPARGRDVKVPLQLTLLEAGRGAERTVAYRSDGGTVKTRVRIPAGVEHGATVRVRGKGEKAPPGGTSGDLLLEVGVTGDPRFDRDGRTLRTKVPVTVYDAVLGAKIQVPTLDGNATINLPPGTRSGQVFRLRGKGLGPEGKAGDLLAQIVVQPPTEIDAGLTRLMEEFRDAHAYTPDGETVQ